MKYTFDLIVSSVCRALGEVYVGDEEREKTLIDDILALKVGFSIRMNCIRITH